MCLFGVCLVGIPLCVFACAQVNCTAPSNFGRGHLLIVSAAGQASEAALFAYDAPVVTEVVPDVLNAVEGSEVVIRGRNFGIPRGGGAEPLEVSIGISLCSEVQLLRESEVCVLSTTACTVLKIDVVIAICYRSVARQPSSNS